MKTNHHLKHSLVMFVAATAFACVPNAHCLAATIPAGTAIVVTTVDSLSSHESRGRIFKTQLAADLKSGGKTVVPAGTTVYGVVETSRNQLGATTTNQLGVNLQSIGYNGRRVPIKTTGAVSPDTFSAHAGLQKRTGVSAGRSIVDRGTKLQFRLAEPVNL
jgi:hypothetical protein